MQPFISDEKLLAIPISDVHVFQCTFNLTFYTPNHFRVANINRPSILNQAVPKRQAEFLAGRYAAKCAIKQLGFANEQVGIGNHRCPVWPEGITGSISHNNDTALCMVAPSKTTSGLGIDVESWMTEEAAGSIRSTLIDEQEFAFLNSIGLPMNKLMTIVFSAKESLFKALYPQVGEYFGFEAASIISVSPALTKFKLKLNQSLTSSIVSGSVYEGFIISSRDHVITYLSLPQTV